MGTAVDTLEILDLRHYGSGELRPLLQRESQVWADRMRWDYHGSAEMILRYVDSKILPGYAAIENGEVVGYAFFVYEGSKGVIGDLFADSDDPEHAQQIRRRLLQHVIETMQQTPGIHRIEAQLLVHESGTLAQEFKREGFRAHPRVFMQLPLSAWQPPPQPPQAGIEIRRWAENDFQPASHVITAAYAGHIDATINDQYRSASGSLRFLNNVVRFPGCGQFDPQASFSIIDRTSEQLIGLLLCSTVRTDVGHVTQLCVLPQFRSRRLGERLIIQCAEELRSRGFSELSLTVTQANDRAVELYRRLGFSQSKIFDAFVWEG
jgi:ribosomal protein S18 acetylase RimI-like enzyme